jgi:outer membrane receptor protein involved in Fe transport
MKKIVLLGVIFSLGLSLLGQRPGGRRPSMPFKDRPAIGTISGSLTDSLNEDQYIAYASVALVPVRQDSVVAGTLSNEKGRFQLSDIRPAFYKITISALGYRSKTIEKVFINPRAPQKDLGRISLSREASTLEEVDITAQKAFMEVKLDKKVYNAEAVLTAQGGLATDILQNIPSVEVDIDGNVSLRGNSNVTILIDGRPSGLTGNNQAALLEQIPAASIEKIEVITNPSARYDADGLTGIINIILKKNKKLGLNGNVQLGLGSQGRPGVSPDLLPPNKYNGSLALNYRNSKLNAFANIGYNYRDSYSFGTNDRTNILPDGNTILNQNQDGRRFGGGGVARAGVDFFLPKQHTLSFSGTLSQRNRNRDEDLFYRLSDEEGVLLENYNRYSTQTNTGNSADLTTTWEKRYKEEGHQLSASANFSFSNGDEEVNFSQENFDVFESPPLGLNTEISKANITTIQIDYVRPLKKKYEMELGAKTIIRDLGTDFKAFDLPAIASSWVENSLLSNNFEYLEQVHAVYGILGRQADKWGWQLGLRAEQALTDATLVQTGETFENDYFNFFPSGFLNYKTGKKGQLQLSYSRRINRPRTRQLNPFTDFSDPLNLRRGNPFLQPEYINSYELGYTQRMGKLMFSPSVYYRHLNNVIRRFKTIDSEGVSTTTYENQASGEDIGIELILMGQITKWWNLNFSANGFYTQLDASNLEADLSNEGYGYGGRLMSTFTLSEKSNFQLTSFYRGPRPSAQGTINDFFSMNLALQHRMWNKKGSLTLQVRDIFNAMRFQYDVSGLAFVQSSYRKWESRVVQLNFSYRFGKQDFNRRRRRGNYNGDGGGFDMEID